MSSPVLLATYSTFLLLFLYENEGFEKRYTFHYCFFEVLPTVALCALIYKGYGDFSKEDRRTQWISLIFAVIGQFFIGIRPKLLGIGVISFGIYHILVIAQFLPKVKKFSYGLALIVLSYGAILGAYSVFPYFWNKPLTSLINMVYGLILQSAVIISGSIYLYGRLGTAPKQCIDSIRFLGYLLLFASDSVYVSSHPDFSVSGANFVVLVTYFSAVYLIMWGQSQSTN